jgi:murein tripeptide amidase MpaA
MGHERFGPHNRPNQNGPEQMGWRTTSQNLNLNRDYMKAETPEMQAMLALPGEWDPIVLADCHVTDGAQFQHMMARETEVRDGAPEKHSQRRQRQERQVRRGNHQSARAAGYTQPKRLENEGGILLYGGGSGIRNPRYGFR